MSISWNEASNLYKQRKKSTFDGYEETSYKKKARPRKNKRSKHKHDYVPAIFESRYYTRDGNERISLNTGSYCQICGRVEDVHYLWSNCEEQIEQFKKDYPHYVYKRLPDQWSFFKDKCVPID